MQIIKQSISRRSYLTSNEINCDKIQTILLATQPNYIKLVFFIKQQ
jgi:hypothetical protein